ncbi:MAG: hypothetical protein IT440_07800 [Phycisphaeraceae bacterium]|nr:hypothetical protein [Phycisphaeraceae bacterium]
MKPRTLLQWATGCLFLLAGSAILAEQAKSDAVVTLSLTQPLPYQVVQRDEHNQGCVPIRGTIAGHATRMEACYELMDVTGATPSIWAIVSNELSGKELSWAGVLTIPAGGWYRVTIRAMDGDKEIARQSVEKVGVGEVFIVAGQSNAGNYGKPRQMPMDDRAATHCQWCKAWRHSHDPIPWTSACGGSPWSILQDDLIRALNVPVAVITVAAGGTSTQQWLPASNVCYPQLRQALAFVGPRGARAVLWHQGESDAYLHTSAQDYATNMGLIIQQSRKDGGWDIPWLVATASFLPDTSFPKDGIEPAKAREQVREGQKLTQQIAGVGAGPDTDDMTGKTWRHDWVHFSGKGLREHGHRWATCVLTGLFPNVKAPAPTTECRMMFSSPLPRFVAQRDAGNLGTVPIAGSFTGDIARVEARWSPMRGGESSAWTSVSEELKDGDILGSLRLPTGWHKLELRGMKDGQTVTTTTIDRVGVGEIFVVLGGESVMNAAQTKLTARDDRAIGFCSLCRWQPLADPVRGAIGDKGTSWPALGDELVAALDMPVEIIVGGYGGTISQWKPGTGYFHGGVMYGVQYAQDFRSGDFRAVLWQVGEMDAKQGTSEADYAATLRTILAEARKNCGWDMPWLIAGVAHHPDATEANQKLIRAAQQSVCDGKTILAGPTMDDCTGPQWRFDGLHYTEAGQREQAKRWAAALIRQFDLRKP